MTQNEQIKKLILSSGGMIQTSQVIELGISKPVFYQYIKDKDLRLLMQYVTIFRVDKILRQYLEVLL